MNRKRLIEPELRSIPIPLTLGKHALIDSEDFELVSQHKWRAAMNRNSCYALTGMHNTIYMHRLIMRSDVITGEERNGFPDWCPLPKSIDQQQIYDDLGRMKTTLSGEVSL